MGGFNFLSGALLTTNTGFNTVGFILPSEVEPRLSLPQLNGQLLAGNTDGTKYWLSVSALNVNTATFAYEANNASYLLGYTWGSPAAIGSETPNTATFTNMSVANNGYVELNSVSHQSSKTLTTNTIMQVAVAEFPADVYRGGKIIIQIHQASTKTTTISEFLLVHDDTSVYSTEYGIITTANLDPLAQFETNIVGNKIRFLATPITADELVFKTTETLFLV